MKFFLTDENLLTISCFDHYVPRSKIINFFKENVVLGLENGSMAQRVQAEFLRELVTRVEALEKKA